MKRHYLAFALLATLWVFVLPAGAQTASIHFLKLPVNVFFAGFAISGDGTKVAINNAGEIFLWTKGKGFTDLGPGGLTSSSIAISADGTTIVTDQLGVDGVDSPARWTESGGWMDMGHPRNGCQLDGSWGSGWGVSGNGAIAVGLAWDCFGQGEGFLWDEWNGMKNLGHPKGASSRASAISVDASTVVGFYSHPKFGFRRAVRWRKGSKDLIAGSENPSEATGVSSDGSQIVGQVVLGSDPGYAFYYTDQGGLVSLGSISNNGTDLSFANSVSDDGKVVGFSGTFRVILDQAFIWNAKHPKQHMQYLGDYLTKKGAKVPPKVNLVDAWAISADGSTIVGTWVNKSFTKSGTWVATLR